MQNENALERRTHTRYALRAVALFEWRDGYGVRHTGTGTTSDISLQGLRIRSSEQPPLNTRVDVTVRFTEKLLPKVTLQLHVRGSVLRTEPEMFSILNRDYDLNREIANCSAALVIR
jgi:hypothetical protein